MSIPSEALAEAQSLVRRKAKSLVGKYGFTCSDREDIEQELMLAIWQKWPTFNPRRGEPMVFVTEVIESKTASLIRDRRAQRRDYRCCRTSLNETVLDPETGEECERGELLDEHAHAARFGIDPPSACERVDTADAVRTVLDELPDDLREICELLKAHNIAETARRLGMPTSTLKDRIRKLRGVFRRHGLSPG